MNFDQQIFQDAFNKAMVSNPIIQDMRSHMVTIGTRVGVLESDVAELKTDMAVLKTDVAELKIGHREMGLKMDEMGDNIRIILDALIPTLKGRERAESLERRVESHELRLDLCDVRFRQVEERLGKNKG
jgi:hypothetical protein